MTKSGRKVNVYANIGSVSDVAYVLENDAEGIGLFRSEFLYLGRILFRMRQNSSMLTVRCCR